MRTKWKVRLFLGTATAIEERVRSQRAAYIWIFEVRAEAERNKEKGFDRVEVWYDEGTGWSLFERLQWSD